MLIFNVDFIDNFETLPPLEEFTELAKARALKDSCVKIASIDEALMANAAGAAFIAPPPELIAQIVELAEFYLFDAKILAFVSSINKIHLAAQLKADAVAICPDSRLLLG